MVTYMPELVDLGVEEWQRSSGDKLNDGNRSSRDSSTTDGKMAKRDEPTTKPGRSQMEDNAEYEDVSATEGHISEGTPMVLLQVNCRII